MYAPPETPRLAKLMSSLCCHVQLMSRLTAMSHRSRLSRCFTFLRSFWESVGCVRKSVRPNCSWMCVWRCRRRLPPCPTCVMTISWFNTRKRITLPEKNRRNEQKRKTKHGAETTKQENTQKKHKRNTNRKKNTENTCTAKCCFDLR